MYYGFVDHKLWEKYRLGDFLPSCFGDENILELCNRCPYFKVLAVHEEEKSQK